jgi:hypothetical protein
MHLRERWERMGMQWRNTQGRGKEGEGPMNQRKERKVVDGWVQVVGKK